MSACLLDCLREAQLEQYFPSFVQKGVTNCEHLTALSMPEYPSYGVTTMDNRVKLFKLIQIVKSVQADGIECKHDSLGTVTTRNVSSSSSSGSAQMVSQPVKKPPRKSQKKIEFKPGTDEPIFHCRKALNFSDDSEEDEDYKPSLPASTSAQLCEPPPLRAEPPPSVPVRSHQSVPVSVNIKSDSQMNQRNSENQRDFTQTFAPPKEVKLISDPKSAVCDLTAAPKHVSTVSRIHTTIDSQEKPAPVMKPVATSTKVAPVQEPMVQKSDTFATPTQINAKETPSTTTNCTSTLKDQYKPLKFFVDYDEPARNFPKSPRKPISKSNDNKPSNENLRHPHKYVGGTSNPHAYFPSESPEEKVLHRQRIFHTAGYNYGIPQKSPSPGQKSPQKRGNSDRICVCVRKRPMTMREVKRGDADVIKMSSTCQVVVEEKKLAVDLSKFIQEHVFMFDQVFSENASNHDVYLNAVKPLVACVFDRGAATCFAFGQTGSGKTHTLLGSRGTAGVYQMAASDILQMIQSSQLKDLGLRLWISFYEIYNSQLYDLLNKRKRLFVRENGKQKVCIAGLMETQVTTVKGLIEVVRYGNSARSTGTSSSNPHSSRSHAILQMEVRDGRDFKVGRLSFVDLAGSERATDASTQNNKQARMEGAEINQSLLALKECIRSLDQASAYTPYRQSKLTHILRDSFTGNCRTVMIANVAPTLTSCDNTLNTLRYADRVKDIGRDSPLKPRSLNGSRSNGITPCKITPVGTLFHPSNIKFSSTPKGKSTPRKSSPVPLDLSTEGSDSPIQGHLQQTQKKRDEKQREKDTKVSSEHSKSEDDIIKEHQEIMTHLDVVLDKAKSVMRKTNVVASEESRVDEEEKDKERGEDAAISLETARALVKELRSSEQTSEVKGSGDGKDTGSETKAEVASSASLEVVTAKSVEAIAPSSSTSESLSSKGGLLNMLRAKESEKGSMENTSTRRWHLSDPFPIGLRRGPGKRAKCQSTDENPKEETQVLKSLSEIRKLQSQQAKNSKDGDSGASDDRLFSDLLSSPSNTRKEASGRAIPILLLKQSEVEALKTQTITEVVKKEDKKESRSDSGLSSASEMTKHVTFKPDEDEKEVVSESGLLVHKESAFTKVSVSTQEIDQIRNSALSQGIVFSDQSGNSSLDQVTPREYKRSPVRTDRSKMNSADSVFSPIVTAPVTPGDTKEITVPSVTKLELSDEKVEDDACTDTPSPPASFVRKSQENVSRMLEKQLKKLKDEMAENGCSGSSSDLSVEEDNLLSRAQDGLLATHEEQLSSTTCMCKQEMQLLMQLRQGNKDFDEYVRDLQEIVLSKLHAVSNLHTQIKHFYHLSKS